MSDSAPVRPDAPQPPTGSGGSDRLEGGSDTPAGGSAADLAARRAARAAGDNAAADNTAGDNAAGDNAAGDNAAGDNAASSAGGATRRRRGSRGGRNRNRNRTGASSVAPDGGAPGSDPLEPGPADAGARSAGAVGPAEGAVARSAGAVGPAGDAGGQPPAATAAPGTRPAALRGPADPGVDRATPGGDVDGQAPGGQLPRRPALGDTRPAPQRPKIGDSRPAPPPPPEASNGQGAEPRKRRRSGRGRAGSGPVGTAAPRPVEAVLADGPAEVDPETLERRRGRERKGRPVGRYLMVVHVQPQATQIAVLEGRSLIEHYVSRPSDDATEIDGNIYLGRVQNVLPGMEAAFVDIGTPKNAVLYRGDVRYDREELDAASADGADPTGRTARAARDARIEELLRPGQTVLCQVTKNPIGAKGARLAQEVSLPGRFVVLIPNSDTYGISKRLGDDERKRLRRILDEIRPAGHGLIVRTAAEGATADELQRDVRRLLSQWERIDQLARSSRAPQLLYREPGMAVRVIREEFNRDYRGVIIDDRDLYEEVRDYVASISPELADRVEYAGDGDDPLPVYERYHVHEQIHKALDRKVWLPSGGSLIIERTEALTVIDVNTGKNVGTSNLEETVFRNNLEAAEEIARQLRLRDIGGIIVIDFIDMEIAANRQAVVRTFREALARDKTRTQVFDISELGLVEMTRKRISEGLVESMSQTCPACGGRGFLIDDSLL
jgi:ribonuclease E